MAARVLYVIGNGFDLYHGLATGFTDFEKYLAAMQPTLKQTAEEYLCDLAGDWSNLEEALAYFDVDSVIDHASDFLVSYAAEDWSDSYHHDYQYEIEQLVRAISGELKSEFYNWLQKIEVPSPRVPKPPILDIEKRSKFFTFNYTPTLQKIYGVDPSSILHIHGALAGSAEDVVLGHGWKAEDRPKLDGGQDPEAIDTRVMEGNSLIDSYFEHTFKPTKELIDQQQPFFSTLIHVADIYVWGHSLSDIDMPYLVEIEKWTRHNNPLWHVSYYNSSSIARNDAAMIEIGVPSSNLRHHKLGQHSVPSKT